MSSIGLFLFLGCFAAMAALVVWGFIGAGMQARPWRMLVLGLVVTIAGASIQFRLSSMYVNPGDHSSASQLLSEARELLTVAMTVLLAMGGSLMGRAASLKASNLYAEESSYIDFSMVETIRDIDELRLKIRADEGECTESLSGQMVEATDRLHKLERKARKLGMPVRHHKSR